METGHVCYQGILPFSEVNLTFSNPVREAAEHHTLPNKYLFGPSKCNHALTMTHFILNKNSYTVVI